MSNNIQKIIDKFDKEFPESSRPEVSFMTVDRNFMRNFLKDSLTSMLDGIEKEVLDHMEKINVYAKENREDYETVNEAHFAYAQLKEVINIINSHY